MTEIAERLAGIHSRIREACAAAGRPAAEVLLLAVSKTFPAAAVKEAYEAGQLDFGESRQQEASPKIASLPAAIRWHFIGGLQRNKARKVLEEFGTIHSVDSLRLAGHLDRIAGETGKHPDIYLEVNVAGEPSKAGFSPGELLENAAALTGLRALRIQGLMSIPPDDPGEARRWFAATRALRDELRARTGLSLPGLSMGMSGDFEQAILEGSTVVRVGSAIFGSRPYPA